MNKVFLSGRLKKQPEIVYTPQGEKLLMFPLWVDEGDFGIEVVYPERQGIKIFAGMPGQTIIVAGKIARASGKLHNTLRLMANKIIWMEE